uniref:HAUS augmin-like complex subunit 6 N-terminal domain-containing protein n=1 Tax=Anopheles dirus TaxID=7168 RepID=A0A182N4J2_9DIPT
MTVAIELNVKQMGASEDVIKVIKDTRKPVRLSRKRYSIKVATSKTGRRTIMSKKPSVKRINNSSQLSVTQGSSVVAPSATASRCEEQLDAAIYHCLHALTKRHPPTDEFRAQFCRGAFLKPNTKAFIQVLHYLFNIYDAREFRKRFYWPIYDKGAENAFRTSTVEYVNSLIERGKLVGMDKIKAHVVVLPGGAKFMKFLLTLIRFVLQEELRKAKGAQGGETSEPITKARVAQMMATHKRWVELGDSISGAMQDDIGLLTEKTRKIDRLIETTLQGSDLAKQMGFDKLMQLWGVVIDTQFREHQATHQRMEALAKQFDRIIDRTEGKLKGNQLALPFSKEQLKDCLERYNYLPGTELHQCCEDVFDGNGKLNAIKLIELFEQTLPTVEQFFAGFSPKNPEIMKYEHKALSKVAVKFEEIRLQMDMLQSSLPMLEECLLRDSQGLLGKDNFTIKNKLFCTPPIVMDFEAQPDDLHTAVAGNGRGSHRLALLSRDDVQTMNARMKLLSVSSYQLRSPAAQPQKQLKLATDQLQPPSPNTFVVPRVARKEKLNPLAMLNRIKAQSQKQSNPAKRAVNGVAPVNSTMNISTLSEMTLRPEFSSTLLGTPEKPASHHTPAEAEAGADKVTKTHLLAIPPQATHTSSPRLRAIYAGSSHTPKSTLSPKTLLRGARRSSSATKRSSLIENEAAVHTSPSGRLESLVKHDELPVLESPDEPMEPICQQRQDSLVDCSDENTLSVEKDSQQMEDLSRTLLATTSVESRDIVVAVPNDNLPAEDALPIHPMKELDEDDLFNVSDGVLTDFD